MSISKWPHCSIKWNKIVKILKNFVDVALNGGTYGYQSSPNKNQSREVLDGLFSNLRTRFSNTNLNHFLNHTHALTLNVFDILGTYFLALCTLLTPFLRLVGRIHIVSLAGQESGWREKSSWDKNLRLMNDNCSGVDDLCAGGELNGNMCSFFHWEVL